eukprot:COSAG04_NODE_6287_length_1365_cov_1.251185_2_plen_173_part_00
MKQDQQKRCKIRIDASYHDDIKRLAAVLRKGVYRHGAASGAGVGRAAVTGGLGAADTVDVLDHLVDLIPVACGRRVPEPLAEVGLQPPVPPAQTQHAPVALQVQRVLDERQAVLVQAQRLKLLVVRLLQPRLLPHVVAAGLEECGEDDRAADGAGVGDVLAVGAVEAALVAA